GVDTERVPRAVVRPEAIGAGGIVRAPAWLAVVLRETTLSIGQRRVLQLRIDACGIVATGLERAEERVAVVLRPVRAHRTIGFDALTGAEAVLFLGRRRGGVVRG